MAKPPFCSLWVRARGEQYPVEVQPFSSCTWQLLRQLVRETALTPGSRLADLEQENKTLRQRVEAARGRVHDLLSRLTFLEEQARETGGNGGARSPGGSPAAAGGSAPGASGGAQ